MKQAASVERGPGEARGRTGRRRGSDRRSLRRDAPGEVADLPLYSAAKAGIVGFSNSLARRLGPDNIRVNVIAPGHVPTPRQRALWFDPEGEAAMLALQCLPGAVEPEDAAGLVLFLASDASRKITKQVLVINAGSL